MSGSFCNFAVRKSDRVVPCYSHASSIYYIFQFLWVFNGFIAGLSIIFYSFATKIEFAAQIEVLIFEILISEVILCCTPIVLSEVYLSCFIITNETEKIFKDPFRHDGGPKLRFAEDLLNFLLDDLAHPEQTFDIKVYWAVTDYFIGALYTLALDRGDNRDELLRFFRAGSIHHSLRKLILCALLPILRCLHLIIFLDHHIVLSLSTLN